MADNVTFNSRTIEKQCYIEPRPSKRFSLMQTEGDVKIQSADLLATDEVISFQLPAVYQAEKDLWWNEYKATGNPTYTLTGYNGETWTVKFLSLDALRNTKGLWDLSGLFHVLTDSTI